MELDDFKSTWRETGKQVTTQQNNDSQLLHVMSGNRYRSKLNKIIVPEIAGSVICLSGAVYVVCMFYKLDTAFLQGVGIASILLLLAIPAISLLSTWQLHRTGNVNTSYAETLKGFAIHKTRFVKLQKLNAVLSYLLLVTVIILLSKIVSGKDLSESNPFWICSFSLGYIFLLFYSKRVMKYYQKVLRQSEELLHELTS